MIRRAGLTLLLTLTACSPAALTDDIPPRSTSDGRYADCHAITEHGVTEHLDAFADRCGK